MYKDNIKLFDKNKKKNQKTQYRLWGYTVRIYEWNVTSKNVPC